MSNRMNELPLLVKMRLWKRGEKQGELFEHPRSPFPWSIGQHNTTDEMNWMEITVEGKLLLFFEFERMASSYDDDSNCQPFFPSIQFGILNSSGTERKA